MMGDARRNPEPRVFTMMVATGWHVVLVAVLTIAIVLPGCAKKKPASTYDSSRTVDEGALGESSLDKYRRGELRAGEEGPLHDVHFAYDSYELSTESRDTLRGNADWLRDNASSKLEVEGHSDSRGTVEYNLALGAKRAKAARDYLVSLGIESDHITTISYGEELPLCREENESCWAENRRAHFVVLNR